MRKLIMMGAALLLSWNSIAQTQYYWGDERKIDLKEDQTTLSFYLNNNADFESIVAQIKSPDVLGVDYIKESQRVIVYFNAPSPNNEVQIMDNWNIASSLYHNIQFGYMLKDGFRLWNSIEVVFKLNPGKQTALEEVLKYFNAEIDHYEMETPVIKLDDIKNALPLANQLVESGIAAWAHPDFYAPVTLYQQDPLYPEQFQMHNTGQTINGLTGTNDIDIDAPEAWAITSGSSSVTVAVIDDGVEGHEDMNTSSGVSRLINGYTPANGGNGTPDASGAHGQACAGIITASHNSIGVRGVSPESKVISVNIFAANTGTQDIANGITWAKNQGADVMSNSWGYTSCTAAFSNITNAISDANSNGRGGKGCVIVFASGNGYKSCVDYPANLSTVVAVGAVSLQGSRSGYSNYGSALDIVAPSHGPNWEDQNVRTTDRMGSSGYDSGNYTTTFGGTSAACPVVAGVAALVLGIDANLTSAQVKNILYTTADDMGTSGFDTQYGNGRANAYAAVVAAGGSTGGGGSCTSTITSFPYTQGFESGFGNWTQSSSDDFDWTRNSGATLSSNTGPSSASVGSFYAYVESSSPNYSNKTTILNSPCFDLSGAGAATFTFDYHMYGSSSMGDLILQASSDGVNYTTVWSRSGNYGNNWFATSVNLNSYTGTDLQLRFVGTTGTTWQGDMAIDDLQLSTGVSGPSCTDITLTIVLDNYPEETSWTLSDGSGTVASGGTYGSEPDGSTLTENFCLEDDCYTFTINDSYGDGICCSYGAGSYELKVDGGPVLAGGASFGSSESTNFCLPQTSSAFLSGPADAIATKELNFEVYPNPAVNGLIQINYTAKYNGNANVEIYSLDGQRVFSQKIAAHKSGQIPQLDLSKLAAGTYLLKYVTSYETRSTKIQL